jgi:hypothetical protein
VARTRPVCVSVVEAAVTRNVCFSTVHADAAAPAAGVRFCSLRNVLPEPCLVLHCDDLQTTGGSAAKRARVRKAIAVGDQPNH